MLNYIFVGIQNVFTIGNILFIIVGTVLGITIGALPGLSATMGVALLIPLTFKMEPTAGLCMLGAIYGGAIYGGSITAILLRTPGTSASVATSWDGFELTKQGLGNKALGISLISSYIGGMFSALCLLLIAPPLAYFSLKFGPPERMFLALFGLTIIITLSSESLMKGLISGFFGLTLSTIGMQVVTGDIRFAFNQISLFEGIPLLPALIGLFSLNQALVLIEKKFVKVSKNKVFIKGRTLPTKDDFKKITPTIIRSSILGVIIGIIPAAGNAIASFVSYSEAKRISKNPNEFGKGSIIGIAASETANNASTGGSLVPLLTLGIPGNSVAAVFLGGLIIHGLIPGPALFKEHADIIYTFMISLFLANTAMLIFGLIGANIFAKVVKVPNEILAPLIIMLSVIGSYAMRNNIFDVYLMLIFGLIGYFLEKLKFPLSPIILAIILGPLVEEEFLRTLVIFEGRMFDIITRPISAFLIILIIFTLWISLKKVKPYENF